MVFAKADVPKVTTKGNAIMFSYADFSYSSIDENGKYMYEKITPNMVEEYSMKEEEGYVSLNLNWKVRGERSWMDLKTVCSVENIDPDGKANRLSVVLSLLGFFDDSNQEVVEASDDDFPDEASYNDFEEIISEDECQNYSPEEILSFLNSKKGSKFYGVVERNNKKKQYIRWEVNVSTLEHA